LAVINPVFVQFCENGSNCTDVSALGASDTRLNKAQQVTAARRNLERIKGNLCVTVMIKTGVDRCRLCAICAEVVNDKDENFAYC